MIIVSEKTIDKTLNLLETKTEDEVQAMFNDFITQQPYLMAFALTMGEDFTNESDSEHLLYLTFIMWKCFVAEGGKVPLVSEMVIESVNERFNKLLGGDEQSDEMSMDGVTTIIRENRQPALFEFTLEQLMENMDDEMDDEENEGIQSIISFTLQVALECLDHAANGMKLKKV